MKPSTENIGVSGCSIIYKDNKVIKTSGSLSYSPRLIKQAQKQNFFLKNIHIPNVYTPYIYDVTENSFTMERIHGFSWVEFLEQATVSDIENFTDKIINYLLYFKSLSSVNFFHESICDKLKSLYIKSKYKDLISSCFNNIQDYGAPIPESFCHGDLIFFNMMFSGGKVCLLDFLDSYIDSYFIDLVKLRQDLKYHYCLLMSGKNNLRFKSIFERINLRLEQVFPDEINNKIFEILEIINILRIEPYLSQDKQWIIKEMIQKCPKI